MSSGSNQEQDQQPPVEPPPTLGKESDPSPSNEPPWEEPPVVYTDEHGKVISQSQWKKMSRNFESPSGMIYTLAGRAPDHWDERRFNKLDKLPGAMEKMDEREFDKDFKEVFKYSPPRSSKWKPTSAKKKATAAQSEETADDEETVPRPSESRAARAERRASRKADWPPISSAMKKRMMAEAQATKASSGEQSGTHKKPDSDEEEMEED